MLLGGATGFGMAMLAHHLADAGVARNVLVVAGENRLTGQSRDAAVQALAQVGSPVYEVPLGPTIPAYYGLVASRYMHEYGTTEEDLAELAVLMRRHASMHPGAQFKDRISVADVLASKPIASPLKLLDCCPVSDGGVAFVVSRDPTNDFGVRIIGTGQAHTHQHVTAAPSLTQFGAARVGGTRAVRGRHRICRTFAISPSTTASPSRSRSCWRSLDWRPAVWPVSARAKVTSTTTASCRSTPMAACFPMGIAARAAPWRIWWKRTCR